MQYDTRDGLPGTTVYDVCQDKEGYVWFGTSNGLSRFDGTHFKNFTVADGLPDNDVLNIFVDSKNRVWLGTFSKQVSYFYQGKIFNPGNTPLLSKIKLDNAALKFCEDEKGDIIISDFKNLFEITDGDNLRVLSNEPIFKNIRGKKIFATTNYRDGGFYITVPGTFYKLKDDALEVVAHPKKDLDKYVIFGTNASGELIEGVMPASSLSQTIVKHTLTYLNTVDGAWAVDTISHEFSKHFLPGKKVSRTIEDSEGNLWFTTLGEGVFRLPSFEFKNINLPVNPLDAEVFSLSGNSENIICGLGFSKLILIKDDSSVKKYDYSQFVSSSSNNSSVNKLNTSKILSNGEVILGFDAFLQFGLENYSRSPEIFAVKSVDAINDKSILVGNFNGGYKVDIPSSSKIDTLFRGRTTKVLYQAPYYYIGSLDGLFEIDEKDLHSIATVKLHPALGGRISDLVQSRNGIVWVATNDHGVVGLKDNKVVRSITSKDGLSSDICKTLFATDRYLFIGTNKGINRVDLNNSNAKILIYSASDGLPSDQVNALYVKDSIIYMGTPKGLTYFNEQKVSNASQCILHIENVKISGKRYKASAGFLLPFKDNNIEFTFVAVSFKSGGDITYHYKLTGLDTGWSTTKENILSYPTLPFGEYKLSIYAVNKFGVRSEPYSIKFKIETPFWRTSTAYVLGVVGIVWVIGLIFNARNRTIQRRLEEKNNLQKQFTLLEQQALQAQMNPHFIFNCLNSIQQYMVTNEPEKANQYLTSFASLIRRTLYISGKKSITIDEEVDFLQEYLDMEKMRFGDSFSYEIEIDQNLEVDLIEIPALMLQPFVENALRHGIRNKEDGDGFVKLCFFLINEKLVCSIKDNGVGRVMAEKFKAGQHIEYQSKGMSLTEQRVRLINQVSEGEITIDIIDHYDDNNLGIGTEVIIKIPL